MDSDGLSDAIDAAFPLCPSCGQQLRDSGPVERPHLYCPRCRVSVMVGPGL